MFVICGNHLIENKLEHVLKLNKIPNYYTKYCRSKEKARRAVYTAIYKIEKDKIWKCYEER